LCLRKLNDDLSTGKCIRIQTVG